MLRPYKIIVGIVLQEVDSEGTVLAEKETTPVVFFSKDATIQFITELDERAAALEKALDNGGPQAIPVG
jgi:hypothetical protein